MVRSIPAHSRATPAVLLAGILVGCGAGSGDRRPEGAESSIPAEVSVTRNTGNGVWRPGEEWRVREDLRLGRAHSPATEVFGSIADIESDADGNIYVLDRLSREVRVFDHDGRHVRTFGGIGRGPGEFQDPWILKWTPRGELLVIDVGANRYVIFSTAGRQLRTAPRPPGGGSLRGHSSAFDREGKFYDTRQLRPVAGASVFDRPTVIVQFDAAMQPVDTFPLPAFETQSWTWFASDGRSARRVDVPFAATRIWSFDENGHLWIAISDQYRLIRQTPRGDTLQVIEREVARQAVSAAEKREALERVRRQFPQMSVTADDVPLVKPVIESFLIDDAGYLWVRSATTDPNAANLAADERVRYVFDVFEPSGRFLGHAAVEIPGRILKIRGSYAYATANDSLGVPYMLRGRISGR